MYKNLYLSISEFVIKFNIVYILYCFIIGVIGGVLGLFLGFNLYNIFEIMYAGIITLKYNFVKYFTK